MAAVGGSAAHHNVTSPIRTTGYARGVGKSWDTRTHRRVIPRETSDHRNDAMMPTREARKSTRELEGFPELLTAEQAAELLGISAATLNRWGALRDHGQDVGPPCYALSDRVRRWDAVELKQWIRQVRRKWLPEHPAVFANGSPPTVRYGGKCAT